MPSNFTFTRALAMALFWMDALVLFVNAGLFIVEPHEGSTCHAGEPCTVSWVDDGTRPLLTAIGLATVGLFTGKQQLVQTIKPVDVSAVTSLTFTPIAGAGPESDSYYVAITSTTSKGVNDTTIPYSGWSPYFRLTGMTGSFDNPLAAATSLIPIPTKSIADTSSSSTDIPKTITIGNVSVPFTLPAAVSSTLTSASPRVTTPTSQSQVSSVSSSLGSSSVVSTSSSRLVTSVLSSTSTSTSQSTPSSSASSSSNSGSGSGASSSSSTSGNTDNGVSDSAASSTSTNPNTSAALGVKSVSIHQLSVSLMSVVMCWAVSRLVL